MTTIKVQIGFDKIDGDKELDFIFDDNKGKIAIEQALTHFLVYVEDYQGWQFANWKATSISGCVFSPEKAN